MATAQRNPWVRATRSALARMPSAYMPATAPATTADHGQKIAPINDAASVVMNAAGTSWRTVMMRPAFRAASGLNAPYW